MKTGTRKELKICGAEPVPGWQGSCEGRGTGWGGHNLLALCVLGVLSPAEEVRAGAPMATSKYPSCGRVKKRDIGSENTYFWDVNL